MHFTGTLSTRAADTNCTVLLRGAFLPASVMRIRSSFRESLKTGSTSRVTKNCTVCATPVAVLRVAITFFTPKLDRSSATPSTKFRFTPVYDRQPPFLSIVPSVSMRPCNNARRCATDARRYTCGICLFSSTPSFRNLLARPLLRASCDLSPSFIEYVLALLPLLWSKRTGQPSSRIASSISPSIVVMRQLPV